MQGTSQHQCLRFRLLHVACGYAEGVLDAGVREAETSDAAWSCNDLGFLACGVGAVRVAAALTKEKIGFLRRVPCLTSRLGEAGVNEEVTRQWTSAAAAEDHPVTSEFLSDASPPRQLIIGLPSGASETPCSAAGGSVQPQGHSHRWVCRGGRPTPRLL